MSSRSWTNEEKQKEAVEWLSDTFYIAESGSVSKAEVYAAYILFCNSKDMVPFSRAVFGRMIVGKAFPALQTRRQGKRGNVRYHYIRLQFVNLSARPPKAMWFDIKTDEAEDETDQSERKENWKRKRKRKREQERNTEGSSKTTKLTAKPPRKKKQCEKTQQPHEEDDELQKLEENKKDEEEEEEVEQMIFLQKAIVAQRPQQPQQPQHAQHAHFAAPDLDYLLPEHLYLEASFISDPSFFDMSSFFSSQLDLPQQQPQQPQQPNLPTEWLLSSFGSIPTEACNAKFLDHNNHNSHNNHNYNNYNTHNNYNNMGLEEYLVAMKEQNLRERQAYWQRNAHHHINKETETTWTRFDYTNVMRMLDTEQSDTLPPQQPPPQHLHHPALHE